MKPLLISRLKRSPLIEVMLRVDFKLPSVMTEAKAKEFCNNSLKDFQFLQALKNVEVVDLSPSSQPLKLPPRWACSRFKKDNVVITIAPHWIGISILRGYECWEAMLNHATPIIDAFKCYIGSNLIQKVSVRSINKILLEEGHHINEYLSDMPESLSEVELSDINEFAYRDVIHDKESDAWIITNKVLQRGKNNGKAVMLDIEVFTLSPKSCSVEISSALNHIRGLKDAAFKSALSKSYFKSCNDAD